MGINKLILFKPNNLANILSDDDLIATDWDELGIASGEVAYSNRLNSLFRQMSTVTHGLAGLVSTELDLDIGSYTAGNINQITEALIKNTIDGMILKLAENKNTTRAANAFWAGPVSGANTIPSFRSLVAADIPSLDTAKITSGTFATARIADNAITTAKILNANVTVDKLAADSVVTAKILNGNVTVDKLASNSVTTVKILDANVTTAKIADANITTIKILDANVTTAKIADANVSLAKLGASIVSGELLLDALISPKHRSSRGYTVNVSGQLVETEISHVILTQVQYDAITKQGNTNYIIVG